MADLNDDAVEVVQQIDAQNQSADPDSSPPAGEGPAATADEAPAPHEPALDESTPGEAEMESINLTSPLGPTSSAATASEPPALEVGGQAEETGEARAALRRLQEMVDPFAARLVKSTGSSKRQAKLRAAGERCIETLKSPSASAADASAAVIEVLRLSVTTAASSRTACELAVDMSQQLMENGFLGGTDGARSIVDNGEPKKFEEALLLLCELCAGDVGGSGGIGGGSSGGNSAQDDALHARLIRTLLIAVSSTALSVHGSALLAVVRTMYNIYLSAASATVRNATRKALERVTELVFLRMENDAAAAAAAAAGEDGALEAERAANGAPEEAEGGGGGADDAAFDHSTGVIDGGAAEGTRVIAASTEELPSGVAFRDAYLLLRALCKVSSKELPKNAGAESVAVRWKILALELILGVLERAGPTFRTNPRFVFALRNYLAPSLLANSLVDSAAVVRTTMKIVQLLITRAAFRSVVKREVASIMNDVVLRFLESSTAGVTRRRAALDTLQAVCSNAQTLIDLFLNYDCDLNSANVFEAMVECLCGTAQDRILSGGGGGGGGGGAPPSVGEEEASAGIAAGPHGELRVAALGALVSAAKSLRQWCAPLEAHTQWRSAAKGDGDGDDDGAVKHDAGDGEGRSSVAPTAWNGSTKAPGAPTGVSDGDAKSDTSRFQEVLRRKRILEEGVTRFNRKPKLGFEYLISHGMLNDDPKSIARFLRYTENIDATVLGEYLGEADERSVEVMKLYSSLIDFGGLSIDEAVRIYLMSFRLPGEAQKIARIMEAFAEQYARGNPGTFSSPDTAYVLAYSIIMLNTDAHNAQVKRKMSKEDFVRNNNGIDDGKNVPAELLEGVYDRIVGREIRISGAIKDKAANGSLGEGAEALPRRSLLSMEPKQRAELFKKESEKVLARTQALFQKRKKVTMDDYVYYTATSVHTVRLMLENVWCPMLATVSVLLERATPVDVKVIDLCLEGFRNCITLVSLFGMTMEKDAFVSSLAKFTLLSSISEMRMKNVGCIRMLLAIAASESSTLGSQWGWMIRAVSQLESMRAMAMGTPKKFQLGGASGKGDASRELNSHGGRDGGGNAAAVVDMNAVIVANEIKDSEVEQIFINSAKLSTTGLLDLCSVLCKVSLEQLNQPTPSIYCLQKLVEVIHYNTGVRSGAEWAQVWALLLPYFTSTLAHPKLAVVSYTMDSLKQLAWKFLEDEESEQHDFQVAILKPFEQCFAKTSSKQVQEVILNCMSQIVLARAPRIKNGWRTVFSLLALAAESKSEDIMNYGFQICDTILRKYLGELDEIFIDAISGMGAYVRATSPTIALAALEHLSGDFSELLVAGRAFSAAAPRSSSSKRTPSEGAESADSGGNSGAAKAEEESSSSSDAAVKVFSDEVAAHIQAWFPLLLEISSGMFSSLSVVRTASTDALFVVLRRHGGTFSPGLWTLIYRGVLLPIFDDVKHLLSADDDGAANANWTMSTGVSAVRQLVTTLLAHHECTRQLLPDVLELLRAWVLQSSETVAREGVSVLTLLLNLGGHTLQEADWELVVNAFGSFIDATMPVELMAGTRGAPAPPGDGPAAAEAPYQAAPAGDAGEDADVAVSDGGGGEGKASMSPREREASSVSPGGGGGVTLDARDFRVVRSKCVVQLLLLQAVHDAVVVNYDTMVPAQILRMASFLERSYAFARHFNADVDLRFELWRAGFMTQVPNLLRQETTGLQVYVRILFWLSADEAKLRQLPDARQTLLSHMHATLGAFLRAFSELSDVRRRKAGRDDARELAAQSAIIVFVLDQLLAMDDHTAFNQLVDELYEVLLRLLRVCDQRDARERVCDVVEAHFAQRLPGAAGDSATAAAMAQSAMTARKRARAARQPSPNEVRLLTFSLPGEAEAEPLRRELSALDGVREVSVGEDGTSVEIRGGVSVPDALHAVRKLAPNSELRSARSALSAD